MKKIIALFDIDGVCIQPRGYRAGVHATISHFLETFHLNKWIPDPEMPAIYESIGITSEWDMIALTLSIVLNDIAHISSEPFLKISHLNEIDSLAAYENLIQVDYVPKVQALKAHMIKGLAPSDGIYQGCCSDPATSAFPDLAKTQLIHDLIGKTRSVSASSTTRYFQNLVLGDKIFEEVYHITAAVKTESYLMQYDIPAISPFTHQKINDLVHREKINLSFITARPSYQPKDITDRVNGNTPEGEMGVELLGFNSCPLIGYGRLCYLAQVLNRDVESFLKPSPVQALAAIGAAITSEEWRPLQWAEQVVNSPGNINPELSTWAENWLPEHLELHIFEDSLVGIRAVRNAASILQHMGKDIDFHAWGISTNPIKINSLKLQGAEIVDDVNMAVDRAFPNL